LELILYRIIPLIFLFFKYSLILLVL